MQGTNRIAPGIIRALVWEFVWRLGSATVLIFGIVFVMALSLGGCGTQEVEAAPPPPPPGLSLTLEQLAEIQAALDETNHLAEAASRSVVTLEECRNLFWQAVEQPPAQMARWNQSQHLDYLVSMVQNRDRCEDRALIHLAGQMSL